MAWRRAPPLKVRHAYLFPHARSLSLSLPPSPLLLPAIPTSHQVTQLPAKARVGIPAVLEALSDSYEELKEALERLSLNGISSTSSFTPNTLTQRARRIREVARNAVRDGVAPPPPPPLELRAFNQIPIVSLGLVGPACNEPNLLTFKTKPNQAKPSERPCACLQPTT